MLRVGASSARSTTAMIRILTASGTSIENGVTTGSTAIMRRGSGCQEGGVKAPLTSRRAKARKKHMPDESQISLLKAKDGVERAASQI